MDGKAILYIRNLIEVTQKLLSQNRLELALRTEGLGFKNDPGFSS